MDKQQFDIGDCVRIIARNTVGYVCDIRTVDDEALYIVDCYSECDGENLCDFLFTVEEHEIEKI